MTLKDIFIKARKSKNLTQQQFASLLGLTTNTIGSIETGKTTHIKSATLSALAECLNVSELSLIKAVNGELKCSWDELLAMQPSPLVFSPDDDYRIRRFIETSNNTYDLIVKRTVDTDFYFTTDKRDHRHLIWLLPFSSIDYIDPYTHRNIDNEIDLYGRLMIEATNAKKQSSFRSIWILFDETDAKQEAFFNSFSITQPIEYFAKIEYVLYNYGRGEIIKRTKITK